MGVENWVFSRAVFSSNCHELGHNRGAGRSAFLCAETHHKMLHTEINHADTPLPHTLFLPAGFLKKRLLRKCIQH